MRHLGNFIKGYTIFDVTKLSQAPS